MKIQKAYCSIHHILEDYTKVKHGSHARLCPCWCITLFACSLPHKDEDSLGNCDILHYENMPMQYTAIFHGCKNDNFQFNFSDYFIIFLLITYIVGTR